MPEKDEFVDMPEEKPRKDSPVDKDGGLYSQLSEAVSPRDIDEPDILDAPRSGNSGYSNTPGFLGGGAKLTDVQAAFKQLVVSTPFPWLDIIQRSRIFPDIYYPMSRILVKGIIRESIRMYKKKMIEAPVSLVTAEAYTNTVMSIAIDGEGIFDILQLVGASQAQERAKEDKII